jgi:sugar (pentulose or hexulose) kinase
LDQLDPLRDTVSNSDLLGRPVACARFMGGREHAAIAGTDPALTSPPLTNPARTDADVEDVAALIAAGTVALPSFTDSGGPFPGTGNQGRIVGPVPETARARAALASLYVALVADIDLDLLRSKRRVIVDGGFVDNRLFAGLLAALRAEQPVMVSNERAGTAIGAALLWGWGERSAPVALDLSPVVAARVPGLADYAQRWRAAALPSVRP